MSDTISQIGPLFYPLLALSVLGMILIVERLIFFVSLPSLEKADSFQALTQELERNKSLAKPIRDEILSFRLTDLQAKLTKGIHLLRLVAIMSPMVGLLGTVIGMIKAFKDISEQAGPVVPSMIADSLWSAMLTTAYGLSIALPCLLAAFLFSRMAEKRLGLFQKHLNTKSLEIEGAKLS